MKKWHLVLMLAGLSSTLVSCGGNIGQQRREAEYQVSLLSYSKEFKPGMNRKNVENVLRERDVAFRQMCCIGRRQKAWADLIKIGQEKPPWYCGQKNIYIAMEFEATEPADLARARDSDKVVQVTIFRWLEDCL